MSQGGATAARRRIRTGLALSLLVSAALIAQSTVASATTAGVSFGDVSWTVDEGGATATFAVEVTVTGAKVPGTPCVLWCAWTLHGARDGSGGGLTPLGGGGSTFFPPPSGTFTLVFTGTAAPGLTHLKFDIFDLAAPWTTGFQPISELVAPEVIVVSGVTDDLFPHLEPFLDGLAWERVDDTVELAEDMTVVADLAGTVCAAAEEALERPGRAKGKRLGTISEVDMALATLCALLAEVAETPVPDAVEEVLSLTLPPRGKPEGSEDVPGDGNGLDKDPGVEGEG